MILIFGEVIREVIPILGEVIREVIPILGEVIPLWILLAKNGT